MIPETAIPKHQQAVRITAASGPGVLRLGTFLFQFPARMRCSSKIAAWGRDIS
jgi:hypothetical protein